MKQQVIFLNGGTSKENYTDYYDFLRKIEFNPYEDKQENWNKTLGIYLGENFEYWRVPFREREYADYEAWKIMFRKTFPYLRDDVIVGAGSLGGTFFLKYLIEGNNFPVKIRKTFFLAAALSDTPQEVLGNFSFDVTKISQIKQTLGEIFIYQSRDDTIVPFSDAKKLYSYLPHATFREFQDKGHFYKLERFPEIEEDIKT